MQAVVGEIRQFASDPEHTFSFSVIFVTCSDVYSMAFENSSTADIQPNWKFESQRIISVRSRYDISVAYITPSYLRYRSIMHNSNL
jgi:hypothetical protein